MYRSNDSSNSYVSAALGLQQIGTSVARTEYFYNSSNMQLQCTDVQRPSSTSGTRRTSYHYQHINLALIG